MSSLILIHGTGVRAKAYDVLFKVIGAKLRTINSETVLIPCGWGEKLGARLPDVPLCIPRTSSPASTRSFSTRSISEDDEENAVLRWQQLYDDPLIELRFLSDRGEGGNWDAQELMEAFLLAAPNPKLNEALNEVSWQSLWLEVSKEVFGTNEFTMAVARAPETTYELRLAVSRAITATMTQRTLATGAPLPDSNLRDTMVAEMIVVFLPQGEAGDQVDNRSIGDLLWKGVQRASAGFLERKRLSEPHALVPVPGDIILYQSPQGDAIRDFTATAIREAPKPRYVLAHSLGSIAAVDVLVRHDDLDVDHLITIGSPAGFFRELNALVSLPSGESLPGHFPQWLNIFDHRDLLSHLAHPVFQDDRITDVAHDSGQPLLAAHSAYWTSDFVWEHIGKVLPTA